MHSRAPSWSRLLYRVSRGLNAIDRSQQILRDELLFAFLPLAARSPLTFDAYASSKSYAPGGELSTGLFPWEKALLDDSRVPRSGRVLLAAAGSGRELHALVQRGYDVVAFEPVAPFVASAREVARGSEAIVVNASYRDLVARAHDEPGPLDSLQGSFDFCLLGWGSLSHLTEPSQVLDVLGALRILAPRAPVMASFLMRGPRPEPAIGGALKLRHYVRRVLAAAGGSPVSPGLRFYFEGGFIYAFAREEITQLSEQAGYDIAFFEEADYPHALLLPKPTWGAGSVSG